MLIEETVGWRKGENTCKYALSPYNNIYYIPRQRFKTVAELRQCHAAITERSYQIVQRNFP